MGRLPSVSVATPTPKAPSVPSKVANAFDDMDSEFIVKPLDAPVEQPSQPLLMNLMKAAEPGPPKDSFGNPLTLWEEAFGPDVPWAGLEPNASEDFNGNPWDDIPMSDEFPHDYLFSQYELQNPQDITAPEPPLPGDIALAKALSEPPLDPARSDRRPQEGVREYIARLRELDKEAQATGIRKLEKGLASAIESGLVGPANRAGGGIDSAVAQNTRDYLDYLAEHGVDQRTLDAVQSGELPMDAASRASRAREMGLAPDNVWYRWDYPLKSEMKGFTGAALSQPNLRRHQQRSLPFIDFEPSNEGLVYASHTPDRAALGAQIPAQQRLLYRLYGPDSGIAGIDRLPPEAYDKFRAKQSSALQKAFPGDADKQRRFQYSDRLAENITPAGGTLTGPERRAMSMQALRYNDAGASVHNQDTIPWFHRAESRKDYTEPLMASGATGTLVQDETGLSTAFTSKGARQLRRADLAPLDPRFKASRNILQGLLVPVAVGAAAGQEDR